MLIDAIAPQLLSITAESSNQRHASSQTLLLSFTKPVLGLDPTDLTLTASSSSGAPVPAGQISGLVPINPASNGAASQFRLSLNGIEGEGTFTVALKASNTAIGDGAGNALTASTATSAITGSLSVDTIAPEAPSVDPIGWDHTLNASESSDPNGVSLSGRSSGIEAAQTISLSISSDTSTTNTSNNTASTPLLTVQAAVGADGRWSTTLSPTQLAALTDGDYILSIAAADAAGNAAPAASQRFRIDRTSPTLSNPVGDSTTNPPLADGVLNLTELTDLSTLVISGSSDAEDGQVITLQVGDERLSSTVASGVWQFDLPVDVFSELDDGPLDLRLDLTDRAGNRSSVASSLLLDRTAAINLLPISSDGWINKSERDQPLILSGLSEGVEDGRSLTVSITPTSTNSSTTTSSNSPSSFSTTVQADAFSFSAPAWALELTDGNSYTVAISGRDQSGNPVFSSRTISVDLTAPTVALQLRRANGDTIDLSSFQGVINAADLAAGLALTSAASSDASTTSVSVGRTEAVLVAPQPDGDGSSDAMRWTLPLTTDRLDLAEEGTLAFSVVVTDQAGNSAVQTANIAIDRATEITIDALPIDGSRGNDHINSAEAAQLLIAGRSRWLESGATVHLTILQNDNAIASATTTNQDGRWQIPLDGSSWPDGSLEALVTVVDAAGNSDSDSRSFTKNTATPLAINLAIAGDNVINAAEANSAIPPSIAGYLSNIEDGQAISVTLPAAGTLDSRTLATTVDGGIFNLAIPADLLAAYAAANGSTSATISATNIAGNTLNTTLPFQVDTQPPALSLEPVSIEAWTNAALDPETHPLTLTGSSTSEHDQPIRVLLNGTTLIASRSSEDPSRWSLPLPADVLRELLISDNSLQVETSDNAGNLTALSKIFDLPAIAATPPLLSGLPDGDLYVLNEGTLLIGQPSADQPVTWSLEDDFGQEFAINPTTGSFSFRRPMRLADLDAAGMPIGNVNSTVTLVARNARGLEARRNLWVITQNTPDPAPDLLDQDGIAASLEDLASNGRSTAGDLNDDGIADSLQPNVTAIPWISKDNFQAATADPSAAAPNSFSVLVAAPNVRITDVQVRKPEELALSTNSSSALPALITTTTLGGTVAAAVTAPYDPLVFRLESFDAASQTPLDAFIDLAPALADGSDPYPGTQVRQIIDLPGSGLRINTYLKWNPAANGGAGSWYEFLADGNPNTYDSGAELIDLNADGLIDRILLTYIDGDPAGGDVDGIVNGIIDDPGMPAELVVDSEVAADPAPAASQIQPIDSDGDGLREVLTDRDGKIIDANNDGIADADQGLVTALRLINDGSLASDYGAITVDEAVRIQATNLLTTSDAGLFSITGADDVNRDVPLPSGISNLLSGAIAFQVDGLPAGTSTQATIHLPAGLNPTLSAGSALAYLRYNYLTNRFEQYRSTSGVNLYTLVDGDGDGVPEEITLQLTDGDPLWDGDGTADGRIIDPGFLAQGSLTQRGTPRPDILTGNLLDNLLLGGNKRDRLIGDLGDDTLIGGRGRDRLIGGDGADNMIGGRGRDIYIYESLEDSTIQHTDRITLGRRDRIDLRQLDADLTSAGNQAFRFLDRDQEFSAVAGELRLAGQQLQADVDGDRIADWVVDLKGPTPLSIDMLIL